MDIPIGSNTSCVKASALSERLILIYSAITTALSLGWILWYCRYGMDFTDESFYLVWIANPFNYTVSATQFGFIYHPLYKLLDGNIAALRQASVLGNFGLAWILCNIFLKTVFGEHALHGVQRMAISAAIATSAATSLVYAGLWLPTPSYNSLALQALLIGSMGLLLAGNTSARTGVAGWILIGIGGWLAFMAKPTTAAALAACACIYSLLAGKIFVRGLLLSFVTAAGLIMLAALGIDGSVPAFVDRLTGGAEMFRMLDSGHTKLFRLDDFYLSERSKFAIGASTVVFFLAAYFSQSSSNALRYGSVTLSILFASANLAIVLGIGYKGLDTGQFEGLLIWAVPFAALLTVCSNYRVGDLWRVPRADWALALTFLALPYAYAFGTNGNQWDSATASSIFWILAGLVLLKPIAASWKFPALLLSLALAAQLVTVALVQNGIESPYRQPQPLRNHDYKLEIGNPGSTLIVSTGFGRYIADVVGIAKQAGFEQGTPMIDLTGRSPGTLFALGASNIGQPWTFGGYPGSDALAVAMLRKVSCEELASAWLLAEPQGPREISAQILQSFGANLSTDFELAGTFKSAEGAGGNKQSRVQLLLKPARAVGNALLACSSGRTTKP